jgi:hypothetical protein
MNFGANWISRAVVVVEVSKLAAPVGTPEQSNISVLSRETAARDFKELFNKR